MTVIEVSVTQILRNAAAEKIILRDAADHALLFRCDSLRRTAAPAAAAVFYLNKKKRTSLSSDQVDLTLSAPETVLQNMNALPCEIIRRFQFLAGTQCPVVVPLQSLKNSFTENVR